MYVPGLQCRLFSPQSYLKEHQDNTRWVKFTHNKMFFQFSPNKLIKVPYDSVTCLPIITAFKDANEAAEKFALSAWTTDSDNSNLTFLQKHLLKWHYRLGNLGFQHLQWICRQGWLGKSNVKIGKSNVIPPKCTSCLYSKLDRQPKQGSTV